ncbi:hypothetical protein WS70_07840 [Burkholderia mayonis]|uniref:Uncharacterized protein n=1 Tax=Burkholderia mayonis TaxID=1385591 RepID=A0A1B4FDJ1_9BURK|nr:hypothetical protein WS70_07840 [Burkholderia mayonis]KVE43217.1 hypothetical protein WS69_24470 [Burkholderia sp. BDU5]KVE47389.1 hypothetical protein WS70_26575 [Burkholderia mayonis]
MRLSQTGNAHSISHRDRRRCADFRPLRSRRFELGAASGVANAHRRIVASSHRRIVASSHRRIVASSHRRRRTCLDRV